MSCARIAPTSRAVPPGPSPAWGGPGSLRNHIEPEGRSMHTHQMKHLAWTVRTVVCSPYLLILLVTAGVMRLFGKMGR